MFTTLERKIVPRSVNDGKYSVLKPYLPYLPCAIVTEINAVTDTQIMLYFGILDGIAVYPFRTMIIGALSIWPSQASCHLYFDTLFYEVMPRQYAVHFILSDRFRQFCLQNVAAYWSFLIE